MSHVNTHCQQEYKHQRASSSHHELLLRSRTSNPKGLRECHLYFYWPGEVADVDEEGDVWIVAEIKLLIGEAVLVFLYIRS